MSDGDAPVVEVQFENIPDELKERPQWLYWNARDDKPKKPLETPDADSGASWTDPDVWLSFEEVAEVARERPEVGIGYVFASGNDDYPRGIYGALDLDNCAREEYGGPKDWLPSIQPLFEDDAYIEWSPSGTGFHIPVLGFEEPDWWTDIKLDGDHEGIEAYDKKFFTFTGDTVDGSGETVMQDPEAVVEWLKTACEKLTGERPWEETGGAQADVTRHSGSYKDEWMEADDVEEALGHLDSSSAYPEWRDIAFAVHAWDSGSTGQSLFEQWSRGSPKFDSDAKRKIEAIWSGADEDGGIGVGTLVHKAKQNGWSPSRSGRSGYSGGASSGGGGESDDRSRDPPSDTETWEYVRYLLEEGEGNLARETARRILREKYHPVTDDSTDEILIYDDETGTYERTQTPILGEIADGLGEEWNRRIKTEIVEGLKQKRRYDPMDFNARGHFDEPHVCVANGVLNLFSGELLDHSPEYLFTDRIPTRYDPEVDTSRFEEFMDSITGREEDAKAMLEMVGHALVPDAHERGWRHFLMLHGDHHNGKSYFYSLVREMLSGDGERNTAAVKLQKMAEGRFSKRSIYGKMANIAGEIDGKRVRKTADLKDITGGDEMEIEPKGGRAFFDTMNTTLMFAANDPPIISSRDRGAIASRLVPIELPYTFTWNPDPNDPTEKQRADETELNADLASEEGKSALLKLALEGIERYRENGIDVSLPESEMERLERYEGSADPMKEFANRCLTTHESDYIVKDDVTRLFREWADTNGVEIGTNVSSTLFNTLDFGSSRPRNPDYSGTSLNLRPWDERKYAVPRVTLTEEGGRIAEKAGLVVDAEEAEGDASDAVPSGREYRTVAAVAESRKGYESVKVEVVSVDSIGDSGTKAVLRDDTGSIDMVQWDGDSLSEFEGEEVAIDDAQVGEYDGRVQFVFRPNTRITVTPESVREEGQSPVTADGGTVTESEAADTNNPTGKEEEADTDESEATEEEYEWRDTLRNAYQAADPVGDGTERRELRGAIVERSDYDHSTAQQLIDKAASDGYLITGGPDGGDSVEARDKLMGGN